MQYSGCELVSKNVMPIHFTVLPQFINLICSPELDQKLETHKMMTSFQSLHKSQISDGFGYQKQSPQMYIVHLNTTKHGT
jgi:hypothetical protein